MFKGASLGVEDLYLLETFQINYFPGWVPEREFAAVLWAYPPVKKFLEKNDYDAAILDIMGVQGYDLLKLANQRGIPALMLTAHALNPENLVKSIKEGAQSYVPKDKITDIDIFLAEVIEVAQKSAEKRGAWFSRLKPFFDKKFGPGWREKEKEFWKDFDKKYISDKDELEKIM